MLKLVSNRRTGDCDGSNRRDFLKVGALGATGLTLPGLLAARANAAAAGHTVRDTSVVWLWLGGGPTHIETFDPKMNAPAEVRSITGEIPTALPGVTFGSTFPKLAKVADKLAVVRSFAHDNSGHGGGTHWVMTGYDFRRPTTAIRKSGPAWAPSWPACAARTTRPPACPPTCGWAAPTATAQRFLAPPLRRSIPEARPSKT
jgi:hypothetical protein